MMRRRMMMQSNSSWSLLSKLTNNSEYYYVLDDVFVSSDNYLVYYGFKLLEQKNMALFGTRNSGGLVEEASGQLGVFYFNGNLRHTWGNAHIDHAQSINVLFEGMLDVNCGNTGGAFTCNRPFCLFTNWSDGAIDPRIANCEFYYLKIFSSSGVLLHDFRPCQYKDERLPRIVDLVTTQTYKPILFSDYDFALNVGDNGLVGQELYKIFMKKYNSSTFVPIEENVTLTYNNKVYQATETFFGTIGLSPYKWDNAFHLTSYGSTGHLLASNGRVEYWSQEKI